MPKRAGGSRAAEFATRHVLLADDGSRGARPARCFAVGLAAASGARLTVVYVREPKESQPQAARKLAAVQAAAAAARVTCRVALEPPVGITNPGRRVLAAGRRERADMIVLGARGAGLARKLLGSVSSYVVSRSDVSVCVVR